jgi:ribosomal protein S21
MATNVRVTAKKYRGGGTEDKDRTFRTLLSDFKRACNDANILQDLKRRQYFEGKSDKKRRKKREAIAEMRRQRRKEYRG